MAVLVEGLTVVVRIDAIGETVPGGWSRFVRLVPNQQLCFDEEIARVVFMAPLDVEMFISALEDAGLCYLDNARAKDIVVVDQRHGPTTPCSWIEYGHYRLDDGHEVAFCKLTDSHSSVFAFPSGWSYEHSLSKSNLRAEQGEMTFLEHTDGIDVFLDPRTGEKKFSARSSDAASKTASFLAKVSRTTRDKGEPVSPVTPPFAETKAERSVQIVPGSASVLPKTVRALRWVAMMPLALVCGYLAHGFMALFVAFVYSQLGENLDNPWNATVISSFSNGALGSTFVYVAMWLAPTSNRTLTIAVVGALTFVMGIEFISCVQTGLWADAIGVIVGAAVGAYTAISEES